MKSDQQFICLFKSGSNAIFLRRGGTNYGLYVTGNNGATKVGANTWHHRSRRKAVVHLRRHHKQAPGVLHRPARRLIRTADSYLVNTTNIGGNNPGTEFCIGKPAANSIYYHGGLNNLVTADEKIAGPNLEEYFQIQETYDQAGFYDDLSTWAARRGPVPDIVDTKGDLTGGELINGTESDFVVIETPGESGLILLCLSLVRRSATRRTARL